MGALTGAIAGFVAGVALTNLAHTIRRLRAEDRSVLRVIDAANDQARTNLTDAMAEQIADGLYPPAETTRYTTVTDRVHDALRRSIDHHPTTHGE